MPLFISIHIVFRRTLEEGLIETVMILADMEPEWIEKEKDIPFTSSKGDILFMKNIID